MKKIFIYIITCFSVGSAVSSFLCGCTDMGGDGVDSVEWSGSVNPQAKSFHNPVWEPSLAGGTVFQGSSGFVAVSSCTEWSKGLPLYCPQLQSNDLVNWKAVNNAFSDNAVPTLGAGGVNSVSIDFCKTFSGEKYWMFYTLKGTEGIGVASSKSLAQGPYTDMQTEGKSLSLKTKGVPRNPFFFSFSTNFYLCYTTDGGTYIQKLRLKKGHIPTCLGNPVLIAGPEFDDVAIFRMSADKVYLFGTVGSEIRYARANNVTGSYAGKDGVALTAGGKGEALIKAGKDFVSVENPMRAFVNSKHTHVFLAYNATQADKPVMASGFARKPMFLQPMELDEKGWIKGTFTPAKCWASPKYE